MKLQSNKSKLIKLFQKQHDSSDCGVACLQSIISFYGGYATIEELREKSGTSISGTTLLGLNNASNHYGFDPEALKSGIEYLKKNERPVILHVVINSNIQHYIVCFSFTNNKFIIGDPSKGIIELSETELQNIWKSNVLLKLNPNKEFEKNKNIGKRRRQWLYNILKPDLDILFVILVLSIVISLLNMSLSIFSQRLIDYILPQKDILKLVSGLILLAILLISKGFLSYINGFFMNSQGKNFNTRLIDFFFRDLLFLPKSFFDNRRIGELVARMEDSSRIQNTVSTLFGEVLRNLLMIIFGELLLFYFSPFIGLVSIPIIFIFIYINHKFQSRINLNQNELMGANSNKTSNYINTMQGIDAIKSNQKEFHYANNNKVIYCNFQDKAFLLNKSGVLLNLNTEVIGIAFTITILSIGSWLVISNELTLGKLMGILSITGSIISSVIYLLFYNINLQGAKIAFYRMFEFASVEPEFELSSLSYSNSPVYVKSLEFKGVNFRYPGRSLILKNVCIKLSRGKISTIIGESGSGKSTLLNLFQQFYLPEEGEILLNGINTNKIPIQEYRSYIGVVPQEIAIFNGNLLQNITLSEDKDLNYECLRFCNQLGFDNYFNKFPNSYATRLGEQGINISGGQKQLIGLCRALFRRPQVLLLDEPSASLDDRTEDFVIRLLQNASTECSILIISHKDNLSKIASTVYSLNDSVITEIEIEK